MHRPGARFLRRRPVRWPGFTVVLYFGAVALVAGALHVIVAAFYFGNHMLGEMVILPAMKRAKTNAELAPLQAMFRKLGPYFAGLGMGALVTGLLFLFAKFGTDFAFIVAFPEQRTIVIALVVFIVLIVIATVIHRPLAEWITAQDLAVKPTEAPSPEMAAAIAKFHKVGHITTGAVFIVIVLMVVAANGGI